MSVGRLDSRTWLVWCVATMIPLLVARHPLVVLTLLIIVLAVRSVWASQAAQSWQWIVRLAAVFMAIGVVFNVLTVHAGNQVIVTVPEAAPLIGGRITLNALAYGVVSGLTILVLVLAGTTVAAGLVWADLMRTMPPRLAPLAVAGSVAWSFLPSTASAFRDIWEAQSARGHRIRGVRDLPPLVVPLLGGGLERAMTMSEALEARGFGQSTSEVRGASWSRWAMIGALGAGVLAAYAFAVGEEGLALGGLLACGMAMMATLRSGGRPTAIVTRYRQAAWRREDWIIATGAIVALCLFLWRRWVAPGAAIFNPYPELAWPQTDILMLIGLAPLLAPAFFLPRPEQPR
jgi:energy-coupling factor transport system permease protein